MLFSAPWFAASAYEQAECIECHRLGSQESTRQMDINAFRDSVHGKDTECMDCHTGIVDDTHQTQKGSGAVDCGTCHDTQNHHGEAKGSGRGPQCQDCHTRHEIRFKGDPASSVSATALPRTCAGCHPVECGKMDYLGWFAALEIASHPKADFGDRYEKTNCLGCHQGKGAHGDEARLKEDRCDTCHLSPDGSGALWGMIHPRADRSQQPTVFAAAVMYQIFGAGVLVLLATRLFRRMGRTSAVSTSRSSEFMRR